MMNVVVGANFYVPNERGFNGLDDHVMLLAYVRARDQPALALSIQNIYPYSVRCLGFNSYHRN